MDGERAMKKAMLVGVVVLCSMAGGCASWNSLRGEGFSKSDQETSSWAGSMRKKDNSVLPFGLSSKAQEIERNLGAP